MEKNKNKNLTLTETQVKAIRSVLTQVSQSVEYLTDIFSMHDDGANMTHQLKIITDKMKAAHEDLQPARGEVIEGVFDGEKMVGHDGILYDVPANYASKSKLIEGDILKLTINKDGDYIYKQIAPIERKRVVGTLGIDETSGHYYVMSDDRAYKVIPASVTFYHGTIGDEVILLVPKDGTSAWAAVENVIKR